MSSKFPNLRIVTPRAARQTIWLTPHFASSIGRALRINALQPLCDYFRAGGGVSRNV